MVRHDHVFQLGCVDRLAGARIGIGVIDRQGIVGERNAGHVDVEQGQLFCRQGSQPHIV
jgi:hypothetical protein